MDAIAHDAETGTLFVRFLDGAAYRYDGVGADVFRAVMAAPSKGRTLRALVEGRPYARLER